MAEEIFDVVDEKDNVVGSAPRSECHRNPRLIHRGIYVLISDARGRILLQRRSAKKDTEKNLWDISCAGHCMQGESYESAAKRELKEELGLELPLEFLGKLLIRVPRESEFDAIFSGKIGNEKIVLDKNEVEEVKFFTLDEIKKLGKDQVTDMFWTAMNYYLENEMLSEWHDSIGKSM